MTFLIIDSYVSIRLHIRLLINSILLKIRKIPPGYIFDHSNPLYKSIYLIVSLTYMPCLEVCGEYAPEIVSHPGWDPHFIIRRFGTL